ncbi:hypothetical protein KPH14_005825 [Odynerus spinipes]|uniref:Protein naked cuticle homolog n=1 Tax=Odynerus spinipes TaxID=1348599 RepID=A0AAD9RB58_9HYME|nr:hypothetical protein KPH14_005825 [Odynerus spinipes]
MATGLVKWWRARFLAGYKPFSVVGGNTEGSDSEELLGSVATPCTGSPPPPAETPQVTVDGTASPAPPPPPPPAPGNDERPTSSTTKQLSFEEFECDVSVAEGDRRRQEFSFTLYDFDGHGKITKDDIAGLVTTIYDTLGASIQVPPCGSKTIKVKLTVSPDQRAGQTRTTCPNSQQGPTTTTTTTTTTTSLPANNSPCCHVKHAASCAAGGGSHHHHSTTTTTHATHGSRKVPRRRRPTRHRCQTQQREAETHSEDDAENTRSSRVKQEELRRRVGPVPHLPSPYSNSSEGDVSDDSDTSPAFSPFTPLLTTNQRKRSGALQRQQLLEIIQANMEKNNLSFHTPRKRHQNEHVRVPSRSPHVEPPACVQTPNYNQGCRPPSESRQPTSGYHKPVRENSHNTVAFSKLPTKTRGNLRKTRAQHGIQQQPHQQQPPPPPPTQQQQQQQRNATMGTGAATGTTGTTTTQSSKSTHILQGQLSTRNVISPTSLNETAQHLLANNRNIVNLVPNNNQQQSQINQSPINNHNIQRSPPESQYVQSQSAQCGKASKKHQLKHATREQDQARAMAQVVRWLEREFSQNAAAATTGRRHVHEHIHHHYHHYHAEALV